MSRPLIAELAHNLKRTTSFISARALLSRPAPAAIVEGLLMENQISALIGEANAGKTFVALSLAAAVTSGIPWASRATEPGAVVYLPFEADAFPLRLRALADAGYNVDDLYLLEGLGAVSPVRDRDGGLTPSPSERRVVEELAMLVEDLRLAGKPPIRLLVIDTARQAMVGKEDDSGDVAAFIGAVRRILTRIPGAAAAVCHHTGWQDGDNARKRERGSSAWRGNVDNSFLVEASAAGPDLSVPLTVSTLKARDIAHPAPIRLVRRVVTLRRLEHDREPLTSCLVEADGRPTALRDAAVAASEEARHETEDRRLLQVISTHPGGITSISALRGLMGGRQEDIGAALVRLQKRKWIAPPMKQRQPYTITAAGFAALQGHDS